MITVKDLRRIFDDTWFVLVDEEDREVFVERNEKLHDILEFEKCEVKVAFPSEEEVGQIVCQISSKDPNFPKKRRYEINGTWSYVVEANSFEEARGIFEGVYTEDLFINDDYDITEIKD